ncbi:MAG: zinc-ribbon domain-containing protein [Epulopiscium sp.]|nr:zinc-ribbon domain-containing protein [Candidatus Epulonipiscium sp.]
MRFCRNCGKLLEDNQSYCSFCGKMVDTEKEVEIISVEDIKQSKPSIQESTKFSTTSATPVIDPPLNNWIKVLLSVLVPAIPGLGALVGLIFGIVFMAKEDIDRKTFGRALLTVSIIFILFFCSCAFVFYFAMQEIITELPYYFY